MRKQRVYLDTSVIGGCFDGEFAEVSLKIFELINLGILEAVISDVTIGELEGASKNIRDLIENLSPENLTVLNSSDEVANLSAKYLQAGIVSSRFREDALHIAYATVNEVDVLISWNFKHIVNLNKIKQFNAVNHQELCTRQNFSNLIKFKVVVDLSI